MGGEEWPAMLALAVSVVALILSWLAYRQKARYHPQPKLVPEWDREHEVQGVPMRRVFIANHGDAAARDLRIEVDYSARHPRAWEDHVVLEPGEFWACDIPLVVGADWGEGGMGRFYTAGERAPMKTLRRGVRLTWREPPFGGRARSMKLAPPQGVDVAS